jgi:hypothetical protein
VMHCLVNSSSFQHGMMIDVRPGTVESFMVKPQTDFYREERKVRKEENARGEENRPKTKLFRTVNG